MMKNFSALINFNVVCTPSGWSVGDVCSCIERCCCLGPLSSLSSHHRHRIESTGGGVGASPGLSISSLYVPPCPASRLCLGSLSPAHPRACYCNHTCSGAGSGIPHRRHRNSRDLWGVCMWPDHPQGWSIRRLIPKSALSSSINFSSIFDK